MNRQKRRRLAQKGISVKTLELRPEGPEYEVPTPDGPVTLKEPHWRMLLKQLVDTPPLDAQGRQMGFVPELMRKRIRLAKIVAKLTDDDMKVELEDSDADEFVSALAAARWNRVSEWLMDFTDAVNALPKQSENGKKEKK